jgi:hypothetical protein
MPTVSVTTWYLEMRSSADLRSPHNICPSMNQVSPLHNDPN